MKSNDIRRQLEEAFAEKRWKTTWDHEQEKVRVHLPLAADPFDISIPQVVQRMNTSKESMDDILQDLSHQVDIMQQSMQARKNLKLTLKESDLFPVIRNPSFPEESGEGHRLIFEEHTAESRIYFAADLDKSYVLIDEQLLESAGWSQQELKEKALFNLRGLPNDVKTDEVAGNVFTFISPQDGYAASRILNHKLIEQYASQCKGDFCTAIPHQDVLIMADLRNEQGYDVLGQMAMHFYRNGDMPVTPLPFEYKEGHLSPIFILAKTGHVKNKKD